MLIISRDRETLKGLSTRISEGHVCDQGNLKQHCRLIRNYFTGRAICTSAAVSSKMGLGI